jgi:hypothetical protein
MLLCHIPSFRGVMGLQVAIVGRVLMFLIVNPELERGDGAPGSECWTSAMRC